MRLARTAPKSRSTLILGFCLCASLNLSACQTSSAAPDELRLSNGDFDIHFLDQSLTASERELLMSRAQAARRAILAEVGPWLRPGDFSLEPGNALAPPPESSLAPPPIPPIPLRVSDRPGRSFTDARGVDLAISGLPKNDLCHELVHFLCGASWRPVDEGLAVFLTERIHGPDKGYSCNLRVLVYQELGRLKSIDPERFRKEPMTRVDYDTAGSFVAFLIRNYGWVRFFQLYRGPPRNYLWVYNRSEDELLNEWKQELEALQLRRSREYYRFRALITNGLGEARAGKKNPR